MAFWLASAALVFVAELFLGTVYLLVLSASLAGAALTAWLLGADYPYAPVWTVCVLSLLGCWAVYKWRKARKHLPAITDAELDDLDKGNTVVLENRLADGTWRVAYRGTQWEARFQSPDTSAQSGDTATIVGKHGIVLFLEK